VWPDAAIALHYLEGFPERFARAVSAADALYRALDRHPGCRVTRRPDSTNVAQLQVRSPNAAALPERLRMAGIAISPGRRVSPDGAEFLLLTNETLLRRPLDEIIRQFTEALA
jgi:threonine aldolase